MHAPMGIPISSEPRRWTSRSRGCDIDDFSLSTQFQQASMPLLAKLIERLQRHPKRIVFSEGADPRVLQAARQWVTRRMGAPILLGDRRLIKESAAKLSLDTKGMRIISPEESEDTAEFAKQLERIREERGLLIPDPAQAVRDSSYYATLMLLNGQADGMVGGATVSAASALRPIFQIIPLQEHVQTPSSLMILDWDEKKIGSDGALFLADCGVIPEPTAEQLCDIALSTAMIARHLTNETPRVAMLSYSTKSNSQHPAIVKMRLATEMARNKALAASLPMEIEGELQVDAALDTTFAAAKQITGPVAGRANVLIFPDLNSGNIAFKLIQLLAGANTFGQIITGLSRPAAEISRGASAHDAFGAAAVVGCQAIDRRLLYGTP